jgi:hypothetical protein
MKAEELAKGNPGIDAVILRESMQFVNYIRQLGVRSQGSGVLPSSEARLRLKGPRVHKI